MTDTEAGTPLTAEEAHKRLTAIRNTGTYRAWEYDRLARDLIDALAARSRPATDPAGLDEQECAECGARCFIKSHQSRPAADPASCGYECPFTREGHAVHEVDHEFEPRPATDPAGLDEGSMQLQMHIAFCEPGTVHSTDPRATCTVLARQFAARSRPATDPAGLDVACERSTAGLICDTHRWFWPSLADRCNGWIALAVASLSVADEADHG